MLRRGSSKKKADKPKKEKAPKPKKEKVKKEKAPKPKKEKAPKREGVVLQKQKNNVYTVLLLLSLVANFIAVLLLWLHLSSYGSFPWWKTN